jgi:hypothetical protein
MLFDLIRQYRLEGDTFRQALDRARATLGWRYDFDRVLRCWRWITPNER